VERIAVEVHVLRRKKSTGKKASFLGYTSFVSFSRGQCCISTGTMMCRVDKRINFASPILARWFYCVLEVHERGAMANHGDPIILTVTAFPNYFLRRVRKTVGLII